MASPQPSGLNPGPLDGNTVANSTMERLEGPEDSIETQTDDSSIRRILFRITFIFYICTIMAYIFVTSQTPGQDRDLARFKLARLV
jgi:hypothetical protein